MDGAMDRMNRVTSEEKFGATMQRHLDSIADGDMASRDVFDICRFSDRKSKDRLARAE